MTAGAHGRASRANPALVAIGLFLLALAVRLYTAGWGGLSADEANCANTATAASWGEMFHYIKEDGNAPLLYVLLRLWSLVLGSGDLSLRCFAVVTSSALAPAAYLLLRSQVGAAMAVQIATLTALCAPLVRFGNMVRTYGLLPLFALAATWALMRLLDDPKNLQRRIAYAVLMALVVYLHHWGAILALGHAVMVCWGWLRGWWHQAEVRSWLISAAGALLLYCPWIAVLGYQLGSGVSPWLGTPPWWEFVFLAGPEMLTGLPGQPAAWHYFVLVAANVVFWASLLTPASVSAGRENQPSFISRRWQLVVGGGLLAAAVISQFRPLWRDRYLTTLTPLLLALYAATLGRFTGGAPAWVRAALPVVLWLPIWVPQLVHFHQYPESSIWTVAEHISRRADPEKDLVVVSMESIAPQADRYLPENLRVVTFPDLERVSVIRWAGIDNRLREGKRFPELLAMMDRTLESGGRVWLVDVAPSGATAPSEHMMTADSFNLQQVLRMAEIRVWLERNAVKSDKEIWSPGRECHVGTLVFSRNP